MAFIKLHSSILDSSVWLEDDKTRIVWFTLMAMADRDGVVEASVPGLAHRARVPRRACERAIEIFMSPDVDSRTPDQDGRRIEKVPGGWRLINYDPYREKGSADETRTKAAERQQRWRDRNARVTGVTLRNGAETPGDGNNPIGEGEEEAERDPDSVPRSATLGSPPDPAPMRCETRANVAPPFAPPRRLAQVGAVSLLFLGCYERYPNTFRKLQAAQTWQELAETYPGGEAALAAAIGKTFDAGLLKRRPYNGDHCPKFETLLAERLWEEAPPKEPEAERRPGETGLREYLG